jgi:iron complex outermembrane receptor protein
MVKANIYDEHYDERGRINDTENNPTAQVGSVIFFAVEFNYFATDDLTLTAGASNIFDEYVDEIGAGNANQLSVGLQYAHSTAANYEGGSLYLRAQYMF